MHTLLCPFQNEMLPNSHAACALWDALWMGPKVAMDNFPTTLMAISHHFWLLLPCLFESLHKFSADDSSRVVLSVPNTSETDYINASFIDVSDACMYNYVKS